MGRLSKRESRLDLVSYRKPNGPNLFLIEQRANFRSQVFARDRFLNELNARVEAAMMNDGIA